MKKKMLFIINPKSGKGLIKNKLLEIIDIFVKGGYDVHSYTTQSFLDACKMTKERAAEYDMVVCSGGDGTLDEIITGMMESGANCPVGYIPAGSTNDFANSLKLSKNMVKAAQDIMDGVPYLCDVGSFNDDYFVYIAAFGIFTDVSYQTRQELKNILGHLAYVLEGVKRLYGIKSYKMKIEANDETIEGDFIYGMITNSDSVGGFRNMTGKHVKLNDGVYEVTLIRTPQNPLELQEIIGALLMKEVNSKYIHSFKTDHIVLEAEEEIPWTLDGEFGGDHKHVEIINHKQSIPIIVK
ncbi:diacylglycerol/lipid kinase family protein [uncultured Robinsoniella sp.]|uniref:diacylglycerol/lipid kinase family protein n=1 Tax=uncultured Robinsoniella sp. TaxID=904190 RepID=UPI00374FA983